MKHDSSTMVWAKVIPGTQILAIRYNGKNYSKLFICPDCNKETWQNLNFLGSRNLICNGIKIIKE